MSSARCPSASQPGPCAPPGARDAAPFEEAVDEDSLLARAILSGFLFLFAFAAAYLLLDSLGFWERLPSGLTHGVEILSGLILFGTLVGHLALASGRLPPETIGRR